ncbi:MAG: hypothetical protein V3U87_10805 [Methylococcaceae bacterium]
MDLIDFFKENYTWFFSGLGVFFLTIVIHFFMKSGGNNTIKGSSSGIQAQRDININENNKDK